MELLYLWIERFNNILDEEFNFSNDYSITYSSETNTVNIDDKINNSPYLFNQQFLNINAIVGKNGTGKTSLFSFFNIIFAEHNHDRWSYPFILITKQKDGQIFIFDNSKKPDLKYISEINSISIPENFDSLLHQVRPIYFANGISSLHDDNRIFSSTFYDASINYNLKKAIHESNESLAKQYENNETYYINPELIENEWNEYLSRKRSMIRWSSPLPLLYKNDIIIKLDFISKFKETNLGLIPQYLELNFNASFFFNNKSWLDNTLGEELVEEFRTLIARDINPHKGDFKLMLKEGSILSFFLYIIRHNLYFEAGVKSIDEIKDVFNDKKVEEYPTVILEWINNLEHFYEKSWFAKIHKTINLLDDLIEPLLLAYTGMSDRLFLLLDENLKELLNNIFECWSDQDFIFNMNWGEVSAGESAILTLFARINSLSHNIHKKTIWLFLDECELYLHPEWQREFFNNLHEYLPKFFNENEIHLFIASHSPFILSDIPQKHIIYLNKRKNQSCEVIDNSNFQETFGANIHQLLSSSFFMEKGLVGDFAKDKINSLIQYLDSDQLDTEIWNSENSWELIKIIGDENVQQFLVEKYSKKIERNPNRESINGLIKKLENLRDNI